MVRRRHRGPLPGFVPTLGFTMTYLSLVVLIPLAFLVLRASGVSWHGLLQIVTSPRVLAAFRASFGIAFAAAVIDAAAGLLVAWVLVRYRFPGRRLLDGLVDLPIALPTAVAGITLTGLYSDTGWLGAPLAAAGIQVAFTPLGILVALTFIGLPFVVRTVQPVLADLTRDVEEAATTLGARPGQIFRRILLPQLFPALLTGLALAFGRGIGEYGSVIFIAGNMPGISEIVPLLIVTRLEQFDYIGAAVLGTVMLAVSFLFMLTINGLQQMSRERLGF
ncbi:MAG TPA: sulfate ABC transporter permease subunit CysT [Stellaceae bacterium]|nr:sulfate ABC transporter permease subunit CysT [Stellaceae bacterium]